MAAEDRIAAWDVSAGCELLPCTLPFDPERFDFGVVPAAAGVFLLETGGEPFLGKSASLRRRLVRLLGQRTEQESAGKRPRLNLRATARAIHYRPTGSAFETSLLLYQAARAVFPTRYRALLRLRVPPLLKINFANQYPRCYVTRRLSRSRALWYGPFPSRAAAEKFSAAFLDLFLVRRCVEAIQPDPAHPGCIYGEMSMCLRPCQAKCSAEDYRAEVERLAAFLSSGGNSLIREVEAQRERASAALEFEEAARLHKRLEKIREALRQRPELAADLESLDGLAIQPGAGSASVVLFPVWRGFLLPQITFGLEVQEGKPVSMDARLHELLSGIELRPASTRMRGEHLALLARWFYRGTRQGEFVPLESYQKLPFRRIVNAINRVARQEAPQPAEEER